ncbi:Uncharacterised protein [Mycobacterium tuberculosis]|nr:Uncharacterised protein [Mycobacterium tuberculosis]COV71892.1 Uncharacterised protein [Mycobacterium tuberculosis]
MGEPMVDGQVVGAVAHQGAVGPDFVVKGHRIGGDGRIRDQPGLQVATPNPDCRNAADHPVHRQPVQLVLHRASVDRVAFLQD